MLIQRIRQMGMFRIGGNKGSVAFFGIYKITGFIIGIARLKQGLLIFDWMPRLAHLIKGGCGFGIASEFP